MTRSAAIRPIVVTGLPRTATSWVGKMLEASGEVVYINEPLNVSHPPGRSPGVLDVDVPHEYPYLCVENGGLSRAAFHRMFSLRYGVRRELQTNRAPYDLLRAAKYWRDFSVGRWRGRRPMLDDPYAVHSVPWLSQQFGAQCVVLVRDPVSLVGSYKQLGWSFDPAALLAQPLLVRDHLVPYEDELNRLSGSTDTIACLSLLWRLTYDIVNGFQDLPGVLVRRHEDLALAPVDAFTELYRAVGLTWTPKVATVVRESSTGARAKGSHHWSLSRRGLSKTAFRPQDSARTLHTYRDRLTDAEIERIRELTADVAGKHNYPLT